jgi:hypothetical protein
MIDTAYDISQHTISQDTMVTKPLDDMASTDCLALGGGSRGLGEICECVGSRAAPKTEMQTGKAPISGQAGSQVAIGRWGLQRR